MARTSRQIRRKDAKRREEKLEELFPDTSKEVLKGLRKEAEEGDEIIHPSQRSFRRMGLTKEGVRSSLIDLENAGIKVKEYVRKKLKKARG